MRAERKVVLFASTCAVFVAMGMPAALGTAASGFGSDLPPAPAPAAPSSTVPVPTSTTTPPPRTVSVAAVGDWLSERAVNGAAAQAAAPGVRYNHVPLLEPLRDLIQNVDLAICHMETPIGEPGGLVGEVSHTNGFTQFVAPYEVAADLGRIGFDRCSTASNHSLDLGVDGIESTLAALDTAGITHTGTARTETESTPSVFEVNGVKLAHISSTLGSDVGWPKDDWRVNQSVPASNVIADVATARAAGAELVILSLHIRAAGESAPRASERAQVEEITSHVKVDLIVMHGPHTIQPVEVVNDTVVYWSLGNVISGMGEGDGPASDRRRLDGLMARVEFTEAPDGSWSAAATAVLLCNVPGSRIVYPGISTLADPTIDSKLRDQLTACEKRSSRVVADLR
ncbi:MAG: CapA family protein [Actinomycetia bacterium]|nr:CapA family protein [Actinomycetes bacterium]